MNSGTLAEARVATESRRRRPGAVVHLPAVEERTVEECDESVLNAAKDGPPAELWLEATDADGELAEWFQDAWWAEVLGQWADDPVSVHVKPTPAALLHPVVLQHVDMVRRVAPRWRIVGHAYAGEMCTGGAIEAITRSGYHEVRLIDAVRPGIPRVAQLEPPFPIEELLSRIRQEQACIGASRPTVVRLSGSSASAPEQ